MDEMILMDGRRYDPDDEATAAMIAGRFALERQRDGMVQCAERPGGQTWQFWVIRGQNVVLLKGEMSGVIYWADTGEPLRAPVTTAAADPGPAPDEQE